MAKRKKASYVVQSVSNALDLLETFAAEEGELGISELQKRLALHKNSVFRLVATLEARGYLEQNKATGKYRLGVKALEVRQAYLAHRDLFSLARPVLEEIVARCNETAYLGVIRARRAVYLDAVETTRLVRVGWRVGTGLPLHCTAMGKAQIAFQ